MYKPSVMKRRWTSFVVAVTATMVSLFGASAYASEAVEEEVIEEVIVYGIKNSLLDAIDQKSSNF